MLLAAKQVCLGPVERATRINFASKGRTDYPLLLQVAPFVSPLQQLNRRNRAHCMNADALENQRYKCGFVSS